MWVYICMYMYIHTYVYMCICTVSGRRGALRLLLWRRRLHGRGHYIRGCPCRGLQRALSAHTADASQWRRLCWSSPTHSTILQTHCIACVNALHRTASHCNALTHCNALQHMCSRILLFCLSLSLPLPLSPLPSLFPSPSPSPSPSLPPPPLCLSFSPSLSPSFSLFLSLAHSLYLWDVCALSLYLSLARAVSLSFSSSLLCARSLFISLSHISIHTYAHTQHELQSSGATRYESALSLISFLSFASTLSLFLTHTHEFTHTQPHPHARTHTTRATVRWSGKVREIGGLGGDSSTVAHDVYTTALTAADERVRLWLGHELLIDQWNSLHTLAPTALARTAGTRERDGCVCSEQHGSAVCWSVLQCATV